MHLYVHVTVDYRAHKVIHITTKGIENNNFAITITAKNVWHQQLLHVMLPTNVLVL